MSVILACFCAHSFAEQGASPIKLATLDWPPYTGPNLPGGGESTKLVRAAFEAVGHTFHAGFYPWSRAISTNTHPRGYIGYYPEYASPRTRKECALGGPIGSSRLGFAQKKGRQLQWESVRDLSRFRIGVVRDYVNSDQLDAAIAAGTQPTDEARDDAQNLRKLIAGRIDLAVIDAAVMAHLMKTDADLRPHLGEIMFAQRWLANKDLYVCFRNDPSGRAVRDLFSTGLRRIGIQPTSEFRE